MLLFGWRTSIERRSSMAMWPLFLGFEDVIVVLCLVLFLLVRERPYFMVAGFLVVLLLLSLRSVITL